MSRRGDLLRFCSNFLRRMLLVLFFRQRDRGIDVLLVYDIWVEKERIFRSVIGQRFQVFSSCSLFAGLVNFVGFQFISGGFVFGGVFGVGVLESVFVERVGKRIRCGLFRVFNMKRIFRKGFFFLKFVVERYFLCGVFVETV